MRISTNTIFEKGTARMGELQTGLAKVQQQVSLGKKLLSPSDDPVASARALEVSNAQEINARYAVNRRSANESLSMSEGALQNVTSLLHDVKSLIVQAGNGTLSNTERQFIATDLQGRFDELLGLANTRDGVGNYLFAGYSNAAAPFAATAGGASYSGDQGVHKLQVHTGRQIETSYNGHAVFEKIGSTNTFVSAAATTNVGTAAISKGTVMDVAQLTGAQYDITITDIAGVLNYSVDNIDDALPAVATGVYNSGQPITFDGLEFTVTGAAADTDRFTVRPTTTQSVFTTMKELISLLQNPITTAAADKTKLTSGLSIANANIDKALDHILTVRASVGSSMKEVESLDSLGEDLDTQYAKTLSELQDLDYITAITDLTKQQISLQAAQQSFIKLTSLSLFNYLS